MKYTLGPWEVWQGPDNLFNIAGPVIEKHDREDIALKIGKKPNARLISAAPEMFELLKHWQLEIECNDDGAYQEVLSEITTLIEKIEADK